MPFDFLFLSVEEKSGVVTCFNSLELFNLPGIILDLHFAAADLRFGHILLSLCYAMITIKGIPAALQCPCMQY